MRKTMMVILAVLILAPGLRGEIRIKKVLSPTKINRYEPSHLVLVDFWATWCAPCINIGKQLESTQEIYKDNLSIISLTTEPEPVVQKFIDKHHPGLTIALDDETQTFDFYGVSRSLPWSVLLNQQGDLLWKGHPADLSFDMIDRFIRENKGRRSKKFITYAKEREIRQKPSDKEDFSVKPSDSEETYFMVSDEGIDFNGESSRLFSEILKEPGQLIRVEDDPRVHVHIGILEWNKGSDYVLSRVLKASGMVSEVVREEIPFYRLTVKKPELLWDDKQISLGNFNGAYLTGDESLSVDNASVREFAFRFSAVMDHPVVTDEDSPDLHDWLVHYKFFDLTVQQLSTDYGIKIELKKGKQEIYRFRKER